MSARITLVGGKTLKGKTIDSTVRREFGPKAVFVPGSEHGTGTVMVGLEIKAEVSSSYEYTRPPRPPSRQTRWDNACGQMRSAIDSAQEVYDEREQAENEDEDETSDEDRAEREKDWEARLEAATSEFATGLSELQGLRDEFQEWEDNLPEAFQYGNSPVSEKIQEIVNMYSLDNEVEFELDGDTTDAEEVVDEAEGADLPRGFGRD